nr:hypothetical protein Iba_chr12bCG8090 [Ipomoea batatas]
MPNQNQGSHPGSGVPSATSTRYIEPLNCRSSSVEMNGCPVVAFDKQTLILGSVARNINSWYSIVLASEITIVAQWVAPREMSNFGYTLLLSKLPYKKVALTRYLVLTVTLSE